jgi:non-ribosomal peptide synthetase component E (peptide arylation enzyme)
MNAEQSSCMSLYLVSLPAPHLFPSFSCLGLMLLSGGWPPANAEASKAAVPLVARHRSTYRAAGAVPSAAVVRKSRKSFSNLS